MVIMPGGLVLTLILGTNVRFITGIKKLNFFPNCCTKLLPHLAREESGLKHSIVKLTLQDV